MERHLTDNEVVAEVMFNALLDDGLNIYQATMRAREGFICSDEFWEYLSGVPILRPGDFVRITKTRMYSGDFIVVSPYNEHGIFHAIAPVPASDANTIGPNRELSVVNLSVSWVEKVENVWHQY